MTSRSVARWPRTTFGRLARIGNGSDYSSVEVEQGGYPVYGSGGEFRRASSYLFDGESVLFGRKGTVDRPLYVSGKFWTVDTMFYSVIDRSRLLPRFAYYWATTLPFGAWATDTALPSMTSSAIKAAQIMLPPLVEQRALVDYLDRETAQIASFIAKNDELIALLTERRATVVDRTVFGLGDVSEPEERRVPNFVEEQAALREFIRQTPVDWGVARFKSVTRRRDARNADASATMRSLKTTGEIVERTSQQNPDESSIPRYLLVEPDDLVVNPMWLVGGAIGVSMRHGAVSPDYRVFRPGSALSPRFLHYLLRSRPYRAQYELFTRAETTFDRRVNQRDLDRLPIPLPPLDKQTSMAAIIDRELDRIDDTIEVAKRNIELARERRTALISAAVTGKIDVGAAA